MRALFSLTILLALLHVDCLGQQSPPEPTSGVVPHPDDEGQRDGGALQNQEPVDNAAPQPGSPNLRSSKQGAACSAAGNKLRYYIAETYGNISLFTAPAVRASLRMASPPGKGPGRYPDEWRQGAEGFGRNYGDAFATRISTHTAQLLTEMATHEGPYYVPSANRNFLLRTSHALSFTFVDRSDSGRPFLAISNFAGAAAGGFVGNLYLPDGYRDITHAGQRATFQFGLLAAANLFREFAPQIPGPIRSVISWVAR